MRYYSGSLNLKLCVRIGVCTFQQVLSSNCVESVDFFIVMLQCDSKKLCHSVVILMLSIGTVKTVDIRYEDNQACLACGLRLQSQATKFQRPVLQNKS